MRKLFGGLANQTKKCRWLTTSTENASLTNANLSLIGINETLWRLGSFQSSLVSPTHLCAKLASFQSSFLQHGWVGETRLVLNLQTKDSAATKASQVYLHISISNIGKNLKARIQTLQRSITGRLCYNGSFNLSQLRRGSQKRSRNPGSSRSTAIIDLYIHSYDR